MGDGDGERTDFVIRVQRGAPATRGGGPDVSFAAQPAADEGPADFQSSGRKDRNAPVENRARDPAVRRCSCLLRRTPSSATAASNGIAQGTRAGARDLPGR